MDSIEFCRTMRAVEEQAARWGCNGDMLADDVPLGTTTATVTVEPARLRVAAGGVAT